MIPKTFEEFIVEVKELIPTADVLRTPDGQIIIYTDLSVDWHGDIMEYTSEEQ